MVFEFIAKLKNSTSITISYFSLMKRKYYFRRQAVAPVVSKNQGAFQGIFHFISLREIARKYFPSRFLSQKKRNAITEKFTANSLERPIES